MKRRSLYGSEEEVYTTQSEAQKATGEIELVSGDLPQASPGTDIEVPYDSQSDHGLNHDTMASSETPISPDTQESKFDTSHGVSTDSGVHLGGRSD